MCISTQWGCVEGAIVLVAVEKGLGWGCDFCVRQSIGRSFAMAGGGMRGMLVIELSILVCCIDSLTSQESMLTSGV